MANSSAALFVRHELSVAATDAAPLRAAARAATALRRGAGLASVLVSNMPLAAVGAAIGSSEPFERVMQRDLVQQMGWSATTRPRALCGLKIVALLAGWREGWLPMRVLLLDTDVVVLRPREFVDAVFAPLAAYDMAGVFEGYSRGWDGRDSAARDDSLATPSDGAGRGWEVNTGVLAVRRDAAWLVQAWADEFFQHISRYALLTGVDQSALMRVLSREPRGRLFPLPPTFNLRQPTVWPMRPPSSLAGGPFAFHSRRALRSTPRHSSAMIGVIDAAAAAARADVASLHLPALTEPSSRSGHDGGHAVGHRSADGRMAASASRTATATTISASRRRHAPASTAHTHTHSHRDRPPVEKRPGRAPGGTADSNERG